MNGATQAQNLVEDPIHGTRSPLLESEATPEALECEPCTTSVASLFQGPSDALSHGSITLQVKLILSCPCCWAEVLMKGNYDDDPVQTVY